MEIVQTKIPDVLEVHPKIFSDERGYFFESFSAKKFQDYTGKKIQFVQDNESKSSKNIVRGLHYQLPPFAQTKLVRVISGEILDVAVDIRKDSPTFGRHVSVILSGENKKQLFIPKGFAHGFVVLSDEATISYKVDEYYSPTHDRSIIFSDATLNIDWRVDMEEIILSEKDRNGGSFLQADVF